MNYLYSVAGIRILCLLPFKLNITEESRDFITPLGAETVPCDVSIRFRCTETLPPLPEDATYMSGRFFASRPDRETTWFCVNTGKEPFAAMDWPRDFDGTLFLDYLPGNDRYLMYSHVFYEFFGLEPTLLRFRALVLHSSLIRTEWGGIVFSAPPGTGKSTQARLWEERYGAEVLNGDRAGLRQQDGGWTAYGLPFAGSSGIFRNESVPLRGIITLGQAKENIIRPLRATEAITKLYPEILLHRWDKPSAEAGFDLLLALVQQIPVFHLDCLPDYGAVELVKQTVFG